MALVLASGSPRRLQLLRAAGVEIVAVRPPDVPEVPGPGEGAVAFARRVAAEKAAAVSEDRHLVLAADTVVHLHDELFGKPRDDAHAAWMLGRLAGRWHQVTTAWAIRAPGRRPRLRHATSRVRFRPLSPADIARYLACGESHDKAGAYAVQGQGAALVSRVAGSYTNVIGLPVEPVLADLARLGLAPSSERP
ncbi:Maf family protein [Myxococcota bacterium]|nr:Maf family protein [Myxococcota bacterium]